jgi:hypothetical protein
VNISKTSKNEKKEHNLEIHEYHEVLVVMFLNNFGMRGRERGVGECGPFHILRNIWEIFGFPVEKLPENAVSATVYKDEKFQKNSVTASSSVRSASRSAWVGVQLGDAEGHLSKTRR